MRLFRLSYRTNDRVPCSQWADFIGLYYWVRLRVAVAVCVWLGNKPSVTVTFISRNSLTLTLSLFFFFVSLSLKGSLGKTTEQSRREEESDCTKRRTAQRQNKVYMLLDLKTGFLQTKTLKAWTILLWQFLNKKLCTDDDISETINFTALPYSCSMPKV